MTTNRQVLVLADEPLLARFVATRLLAVMVDVQARHGFASVVLTGGGVGTKVLEELARHTARDAVDWSRVDVFWGDERFVAADDPERNERGARTALLAKVPVDEARIHPIASSDEVATAEEAAAAYVETLAAVARSHGHAESIPRFDVLLLGMGPEGHVASLFPDTPAVHEAGPAVAVHDCAKPPPDRVTLTFPTIRSAAEVWVVAAGTSKAAPIASALAGAPPNEVPVAGVHGRERTLFLLDQAAAGQVPVEFRPRRD